jgi:N-acyl-D-amino-acid deacylase
MVHFSMCEEDVEEVMRSPFAMVGSDASARSISGKLSRGKPHPRAFGTFPRLLGRYSRERGVIGLERAIQKMTSAPAKKMGLIDRGLLKEGNWADIVIFDPDEISDAATYKDPHQISKGIRYVFVNGKLAVENGILTGEMAGRVLRFSHAAKKG